MLRAALLALALLGAAFVPAGMRPALAAAADPYQPELPAAAVETFGTGRALRREGRFAEAVAVFEALLKRHPDHFLASYDLGLAYAAMGATDQAIASLRRARAIRETQGLTEYTVYNSLGWVQMSSGRYAAAEETFRTALRHDDALSNASRIRLYNNIGLLYYYLQDTARARRYLGRAAEAGSATARETLALVDELERTQRELDIGQTIQLAYRDGEYIAKQIWLNETGGKTEYLTWWGEGEVHASIGLGHFIWYPAGFEGPFQETFPGLLDYLADEGVRLPDWLAETRDNPWPNRTAFVAAQDDPRMLELRELMRRTMWLQVRYMIQRLHHAIPSILAAIPPGEQEHVRRQFERVLKAEDGSISRQGVYALLDYVNFKGEGVKPTERYEGQGWGLLQALQTMNGTSLGATGEFADAAFAVLSRRVENSPPEKNESRYLAGWKNRLDTYRTATN